MAREFKRSDRVSDQIQRLLGELLVSGSVKDPRLAMVTVTGVKVSSDLSHATVYFTVHGDDARKQAALQGFGAATGFFRSHLRQNTDMRQVPDLSFRYDVSIDEGEKIDRLLREVRQHEPD